VKYSMSRWLIGWSMKSSQLENASSITSKQSFSWGHGQPAIGWQGLES
jgi:hypothetical protein